MTIKRVVIAMFFAFVTFTGSGCSAGCGGGAASLLRVATDSLQSDPMQVNVVHAEEQVCTNDSMGS